MRIWRRRDSTRLPTASESWEDRSLTHAIPMSTSRRTDQTNLEIRNITCRNGDGKGRAVTEAGVVTIKGVCWSRETGEEIGWYKDFHAEFLWVKVVFWVGARDENAPVLKEDGFGVVETSYYCRVHDTHARIHRLGRVVEDGAEIGDVGEAEAGNTG